MRYNIYTEESMDSQIITAQGIMMPCATYMYLRGILSFDTENFRIEDLSRLNDVYSSYELCKLIKALAEKGYYIMVSDDGSAKFDRYWRCKNLVGRIEISHNNSLQNPMYLKDLV